jgi:hypothetical protein
MRQEGTNGTGNRDFEEQPRLGSERTTSGIYRKTIGLEIVKRAVGISSGLRKIRNWTLWGGGGSAPTETEEPISTTSAVSVRRAEKLEAPATRDRELWIMGIHLDLPVS